MLALHVLPGWRDWRLRDIERVGIQQWVAEKVRGGLGWQTVRNAWVLLSGNSRNRGRIRLSGFRIQRGASNSLSRRLKQKPAMIAGDAWRMLLEQVDEPYRTMVSLIAATGLRVGELLALRWGAIDLEIGTLAVRESVYEGTFQTPKTQRAMRTIPLGPHIVKALTSHRRSGRRREPRDWCSAIARAVRCGNRRC